MDIGVEEISRWHRARGWLTVGYHYVIRRDGAVETGREPGEMGAHVLGHNHDSIGICMVGGKSRRTGRGENNFTEEQFEALHGLIEGLRLTWPDAKVVGHRDLTNSKECPAFDAIAWWNSVN